LIFGRKPGSFATDLAAGPASKKQKGFSAESLEGMSRLLEG